MFKTVAMENTWTVVRTDPAEPRHMEIVATFYDEARARDYADMLNGGEPREEAAAPEPIAAKAPAAPKKREAARPNGGQLEADLSQRQSAVLKAMRAKADAHNQVAVKAAVLASAAQIPLGSLHSVLGSLEKKQLIKSTQPGSARSPAVYQVL
jgi:hypothetical protein